VKLLFLHGNAIAILHRQFATRSYPESSIMIYIGERELGCNVYLCHHPEA